MVVRFPSIFHAMGSPIQAMKIWMEKGKGFAVETRPASEDRPTREKIMVALQD